MLNVDGGYLTFKLSFGGYDQWQAKHGTNVSLFAMDNKPDRRKLYPQYKEHRNDGKEDVLKLVYELRNRIEQEQILPLCSIEGLEADDLVACWNIFNPTDQIFGVDKDYFQLPDLRYIFYHNGKIYDKYQVLENLPEYVFSLAFKNFSLYQVLLGDVADRIPRLLAKGKEGKKQIDQVLFSVGEGTLDQCLMDMFGEKVRLNAQLVLFPYYAYCWEDDWFGCWCAGGYYEQINWCGLYDRILQLKLPNRVTQDKEVWDLFSLT
jgi:hypothetical protein